MDFGAYPEWQIAVKDCEVQSRDDDGRGRRVEFEIDAKVKTVSYTLDYSYEEPHLLSWRLRGGRREATWTASSSSRTRATARPWPPTRLRIDAGVWLPGPMASMLTDR